MENKILIAGFGGQGILLLGQLIGYAATHAGLQATYYPFYGPEQRGGTASCSIVISDDEIGSPVFEKIDILVAMNEPSLVKFMPGVIPGGTIFINSSLAKMKTAIPNVNLFHIPVTQIAQELGLEKVSNLVMLGAFVGATRIVTDDHFYYAIEDKLAGKKELLEINLLAYRKGLQEIN